MALDSFKRDFGLLDTERRQLDTLQGNIVSTFQAGCFFGALCTFPVAEKIGRKKAILIVSCIFMVGGILMTAANGMIGLLIGGRAIAGFGIGALSLIVPVYIAETSPPSIRGRLVGFFEVNYFTWVITYLSLIVLPWDRSHHREVECAASG
jgi:MFS family permease